MWDGYCRLLQATAGVLVLHEHRIICCKQDRFGFHPIEVCWSCP